MKNRSFFKDWFVFPFAVIVYTECLEYYPPKGRIELHFLWWHWRWCYSKKDKE